MVSTQMPNPINCDILERSLIAIPLGGFEWEQEMLEYWLPFDERFGVLTLEHSTQVLRLNVVLYRASFWQRASLEWKDDEMSRANCDGDGKFAHSQNHL